MSLSIFSASSSCTLVSVVASSASSSNLQISMSSIIKKTRLDVLLIAYVTQSGSKSSLRVKQGFEVVLVGLAYREHLGT